MPMVIPTEELIWWAISARRRSGIASTRPRSGRLLGQASSPPFEWPWTPSGPGRYTFTLLATDEHGNQMMSAPVSAFSLLPNERFPIVPRGSVWKYLDDDSDQGTAWRAPEFDDSVWASGPAELGYGDGARSRPRSIIWSCICSGTMAAWSI